MHLHPNTDGLRQIAGLVKLWACMVCAACYVGVLLLRPWTSMPPTQCEANCTAAAVWRRSRRDPVHIRALRGPRWDAGIARDGCVGVLLSAVSRPCGQGITWRRTSTTHKTSTILDAIPVPIQRDQHARRVRYRQHGRERAPRETRSLGSATTWSLGTAAY